MKKCIATVLLLITLGNLFGQVKNQDKLEINGSSFGQFLFRDSSLELTQEGFQQLEKFGKWYLANSNESLCPVYLSGLVTESELKGDSFVGVKRCKIIIDSLASKGIDTSFFFITTDKLRRTKEIGVGFVVDTKHRVMLEPTNEDEYFKDDRKIRKKG